MMSLMSGGSYSDGLFSESIMVAMASLIGHIIYGGVLGKIYKPESVVVNVTA
ncbi:MAG: hypothetical protein IPK06_17695 [Ignavibacteriae bacterium]|nr:hypothetical protein [Ignavibacteriota bacterium]